VAVPRYADPGEIAVWPDGESVFLSLQVEGGWTALLVRVADGKVELLPRVRHVLQHVAFSNDGTRLAAAVVKGEQQVYCWELPARTLLGKFPVEGKPVAFEPDGKLLVANEGAHETLILIDPDNGNLRALVKLPQVGRGSAAAYSPDRRLLAVNTTRDITVWDLKADKALHHLPGGARALAFS